MLPGLPPLSPLLDQKVSLTSDKPPLKLLETKKKKKEEDLARKLLVIPQQLQFIYAAYYLNVITFSRHFCRLCFCISLNLPTLKPMGKKKKKEAGCPGFTALICLRSGIWSDCMFVFHYASTTNPFCWKSSPVPCVAACLTHASRGLWLRLCPAEVRGDWVTLVPSCRLKSCGGSEATHQGRKTRPQTRSSSCEGLHSPPSAA